MVGSWQIHSMPFCNKFQGRQFTTCVLDDIVCKLGNEMMLGIGRTDKHKCLNPTRRRRTCAEMAQKCGRKTDVIIVMATSLPLSARTAQRSGGLTASAIEAAINQPSFLQVPSCAGVGVIKSTATGTSRRSSG